MNMPVKQQARIENMVAPVLKGNCEFRVPPSYPNANKKASDDQPGRPE
jgi:hypothetical protein